MDNWVIIHTTMFPQDIAIPQGVLENAGIATFVKDELTAQVHNFYSNALGGVKLMVREGDVKRAYELLVEGGFIVQPLVKEDTVHDFDRVHCPFCSSDEIERTREVSTWSVLSALLIHIPLPVFKPKWHCWHCDRSWRS